MTQDKKTLAVAAKIAAAFRELDAPAVENPFDAIPQPDHLAGAAEQPRILAQGEAAAIADGIDQLVAHGDVARIRNLLVGIRSLFGMLGVVA